MTGTTSGVSGVVQYDATVMCFNESEHEDGVHMIHAEEQSEEGNDILEYPECGVRRAVNVHVAPLGHSE